MAEKRYYDQPAVKQLDIRVVRTGEDSTGRYCILDETIFYPEGGGQPADHGEIGGFQVRDVQMVEGEIRHYTNEQLHTGEFRATLDWARRWDHMQQHTGQHLLSAAFDDLLGMKTVSFHLGADRSSIDLDVVSLTEAQTGEVEEVVRTIIRKHLPIHVNWMEKEEALQLKLRKPPAVEGPIRVVSIEGVDTNACGGTHPENTADVGLVKIVGTEKVKAGLRVYFLCGERAFHHFHLLAKATDELVQQLNAPVSQLTEAAAALIQEKLKLEKEAKQMRSKLLEFEAAALSPVGKGGVMQAVYDNRPLKELQQLAKAAIENHPAAAVMLLSIDEEGTKFVCANGAESPGELKTLLPLVLEKLDGKGGGNERLVQGGGKGSVSPETLIGIFSTWRENLQ
ncbi:MAG TPA: alanyl-tRNA editing protein [Planococcus sp. (in: firmicutes)]|nr:alanyl-tRNA editing protein [Planococcus sp. (in: firmicutes)]